MRESSFEFPFPPTTRRPSPGMHPAPLELLAVGMSGRFVHLKKRFWQNGKFLQNKPAAHTKQKTRKQRATCLSTAGSYFSQDDSRLKFSSLPPKTKMHPSFTAKEANSRRRFMGERVVTLPSLTFSLSTWATALLESPLPPRM